MLLIGGVAGAQELDTSSTGLPPVILLLITVFGAALLSAVAGFLGARLQAQWDHKKWVRERRLDAYLEYLWAMEEQLRQLENWSAIRTELAALEAKSDMIHNAAGKVPANESMAELQEWRAAADRYRDQMEKYRRSYEDSRKVVQEKTIPIRLLGPSSTIADLREAPAWGTAEPGRMREIIDRSRAAMRKALDLDF